MSSTGGRRRVEWLTVAVAVAIYAGFGLLTWSFDALPWWVVAPAGAYLVAWHGSLQHEVIHGHPTRWAALNEALVYPSLWLWMPHRVYREAHEQHHRTERLTDPLDDPESFYVPPAQWAGAGRVRRALLLANNTAIGRLVIGPFLAVARLAAAEARRAARGDTSHARAWLHHLAGSALVLAWVSGACGIPLAEYLALVVLPALSLTALRSFAEHRASPDPRARTAVVEAGPLLALVYLNNNLHVVHHREPHLPWFALPARWRERHADLLAENGGYAYRGYAEVLSRHALSPREPVAWPLG